MALERLRARRRALVPVQRQLRDQGQPVACHLLGVRIARRNGRRHAALPVAGDRLRRDRREHLLRQPQRRTGRRRARRERGDLELVPTINDTQIVFGLDSPRAYRNGEAVTIVSRGAPFARRMVGTVQAGGGTATTTITVNVPAGGITGSGTYSDWTLNTEPGPVVIANNVVALTGLFGIDHASNFTVTGNRPSNIAQRCRDFELDYGGTMRNIVSTGNTCTDSGPGSTNVFLGTARIPTAIPRRSSTSAICSSAGTP